MHSSRNSGFTLIELAIVMAVIGLIIGAIAAGRSIIFTSGIRSVIADIQQYQRAINNFQEKYSALPGDMKNATSYWRADTSTGCGTPVDADRVVKTTTCNGNGNGQLGDQYPTGRYNEVFTAWVQLADAGLVQGQFTGISHSNPDASSDYAYLGENVPESRIEGTGFAFSTYIGNGFAGDTDHYAGDYSNATLIFGSDVNGTHKLLYDPALLASDAQSMDEKLDDGRPGLGRIKSFTTTRNANCTSSDTASAATYLVTNTAVGCTLLISMTE